jgi:hypothetical protein
MSRRGSPQENARSAMLFFRGEGYSLLLLSQKINAKDAVTSTVVRK